MSVFDNVSTDSQIDFVMDMDSEPDRATYHDTTADDQHGATADVRDGSPTRHQRPTATSPVSDRTTTSANGGADTTTRYGRTITMTDLPTTGIAPGDGDLMPPRFTDDRQTDADDWIQDFTDYIQIRQVPKPTAIILLRNRLNGAARKWFEALPPELEFDEMVRRFRKRFATNAGRRDELLDGFWNRRQGPDEPTSTYIEEMVSMARRMQLDNEPLMRQGIIQGLRPEIRRDVRLLRPTTLEELAEAAAIGESNTRLSTTRPRTTGGNVDAQIAEMRSMIAALTDLVATQQAPATTPTSADPPTRQPTPATTTTAAATALHVQQDVTTMATAPMTNATDPRNITVQLVMPPSTAAQYGGNYGGASARPPRGRGRGYRGPWRNQPVTQPLNAAAPPFRGNLDQPATGPPGGESTPTCSRCGRRHAGIECPARNAICYECGISGHFARCCQYAQAQH